MRPRTSSRLARLTYTQKLVRLEIMHPTIEPSKRRDNFLTMAAPMVSIGSIVLIFFDALELNFELVVVSLELIDDLVSFCGNAKLLAIVLFDLVELFPQGLQAVGNILLFLFQVSDNIFLVPQLLHKPSIPLPLDLFDQALLIDHSFF